MADHRKRFDKWRKKLPPNSAYLVEQVLSQVVPEFERRGFGWYSDYAGGDPSQIAANDLPLQRRSGAAWPTVQILFDKRQRPAFSVNFGALPPVCKRVQNDGYTDVPRERAIVYEGPVYFALCQGRKRDYDCQYGYYWFRLRPQKFLDSEIEYLRGLLPELFELFDQGIPEEWGRRKFGYVTKHILLAGSRQTAFSE